MRVGCVEVLLQAVLLVEMLQALLCTIVKLKSGLTFAPVIKPTKLVIKALPTVHALSHAPDTPRIQYQEGPHRQPQQERDAPAARQTSMASWAAWARLASSARQDSSILFSCSFKAPQTR